MDIKSLQEKRNAIMAEATAIAAGSEITAEQRSKFDGMLADVATIDSDINRVKAVEEHRAALKAVDSPKPAPGESNDPTERAEVRNAKVKASFRSYLATGKVETRDLTSVNTGVALPVLFDPLVIEAKKSYGEIYDLVSLMKSDHGNPIKIVLDNDTANGLAPVTVGTSAAETDPVITGLTLQVDNFTTGVVRIDNGLLNDAGFDLESFIRDKFLKRFMRGSSSLILSGDGGSVASLTTAYNADFVLSNTINKLAYIDFASAIGLLDPAYQMNAVWAMSNATLAYVIGLTDVNNRPLFLPDYGSAASGFVGTILGRPVKLVTQLPAVATGNFPVLFGDFREGYMFRQQNPGVGILRLNELYAAGYETGFVGFARVGGIATNAGTSPIISIKIQ